MAKKTLLITGCSSGIGEAAARRLSRRFQVYATCRREEDCARLRAEGLTSFRLDHTEPQSIRAALAEATARGPLDAIYVNGAYGLPGAVEDLPTDALREIFEANFFGYHEIVRQVIPIMRAQGKGRIVLCSSVLGFVAYKWRAAYVATKYALEGYADVLRLEMADTPIKIVLIEPGPITSALRQKSVPHFERWIDWKASPRAAQYEASLLKRLYAPPSKDPFELPPEAVAEKLERALTVRDPAPRYFVTTPTWIAMAMRRALPTRALDRILARG